MLTLLRLLAGVALLVWATQYIKAGVVALCGPTLRQLIAGSVASRPRALAVGTVATLALQSSTACAVFVSSFVAQGFLALGSALTVMAGANVGTALLVLAFSFDLSWLSPVLLLAGVPLVQAARPMKARETGRIIVGLGLLMLALHLISEAAAPIASSPELARALGVLDRDVLLAVAAAALMAVLCYSSLAVILICSSLAAAGAVSLQVTLALVIGANIGSGLSALLSLLPSGPSARKVAVGNLVVRIAGGLLALACLAPVSRLIQSIHSDLRLGAILFHLGFNAALAVLASPFAFSLAALCDALSPSQRQDAGAAGPRHLDPDALVTPSLALSNATREVLRMGDRVARMFDDMLTVLKTNDASLLEATRRLDDEIDALYTGVKLYLARMRSHLPDEDIRRWTDVLSMTIRLEHVGDIIDGILEDARQRKVDRGLHFSEEGMREIMEMHRLVRGNLELAISVFIHHHPEDIQRLALQKAHFRRLEAQYFSSHIDRLTRQSVASMETSSLHLDLIGDMRRMNSLLCSSVTTLPTGILPLPT